MSWDHERVEELLAGYVLRGLDPEDAALAERALIEHVPGCGPCRRALEDFRLVAGDLALAAPAARPPDTLRARLRRTVAPEPGGGRRWAGLAASGLAAALLAGAVGWNVSLAARLDDAETRQRLLVDAVSTLGHPEAGVVPLHGSVRGRMALLFLPGEDRMYLVATNMPEPERGVYRVWLVSGGRVRSAGTFVPRGGVVMVGVEGAPEELERVMVTHEPSADSPTPSASPVAVATVTAG